MSFTHDAGLVVETAAGFVRGAREGSLTVFRGLPYAEPPVGERRWCAAEPIAPWSGVRDATGDGPVPVQSTGGPFRAVLGDPTDGGPTSEDCLTLTLWTPAADDGNRPVLVWIHGGGFITGAGSWDIYSGASLASRGDIVVVAINYRTGPFGYLHLGDDDPAGSNFGLSDQLCALEWVRENAARFGGDPDQITLCGQSAGAWSILALLGLPEPPAVRGAIVQSPVLDRVERSREDARAFTELYMDALGVDSVDALRGLSPIELMRGIRPVMPQILEWGALVMPFLPTIDGKLLPRPVQAAFVDAAPDIGLILGWTRREMSFFFAHDPTIWEAGRERVVEKLGERLGEHAPAAYRRYAERYGDVPSEVLVAHAGDLLVRGPALEIAERRAQQGLDTWAYELDLELPAANGRLNACHCAELPFVFDTGDAWHAAEAGIFEGFDFGQARTLREVVQDSWLSLARTGRPAPSWQPFGTERSILQLNRST